MIIHIGHGLLTVNNIIYSEQHVHNCQYSDF